MTTWRQLLLAVGAAALQPVWAQPAAVRTIGILAPQSVQSISYFYPPFLDGMRELGYQPGINPKIILKSAEGKLDLLPALANELVAARVDLILAYNTPGASAAIRATKEIPIVISQVGDPLGSGFVTNLARPGGNVTGVSNVVAELTGKRLGLLKEIVPKAKRIGALYNPEDPVTARQLKDAARAAQALHVDIKFYPVRTIAELGPAFKQMLQWRAEAALWIIGQQQAFQSTTIKLAEAHRLPFMLVQRTDVEHGALVSYYADNVEMARHTAMYVDRILKGAKPGDLPIDQPTKFEFALNLKTAKALGLTVPKELVSRADILVQ